MDEEENKKLDASSGTQGSWRRWWILSISEEVCCTSGCKKGVALIFNAQYAIIAEVLPLEEEESRRFEKFISKEGSVWRTVVRDESFRMYLRLIAQYHRFFFLLLLYFMVHWRQWSIHFCEWLFFLHVFARSLQACN